MGSLYTLIDDNTVTVDCPRSDTLGNRGPRIPCTIHVSVNIRRVRFLLSGVPGFPSLLRLAPLRLFHVYYLIGLLFWYLFAIGEHGDAAAHCYGD